MTSSFVSACVPSASGAAPWALYIASPSFMDACTRSFVLALIASVSSPSRDEFTALLIFGSVRLGVLYHSIDIAFAEAAGGLDPDLLLLVGCLVLRRYVDNAIGVDIEG